MSVALCDHCGRICRRPIEGWLQAGYVLHVACYDRWRSPYAEAVQDARIRHAASLAERAETAAAVERIAAEVCAKPSELVDVSDHAGVPHPGIPSLWLTELDWGDLRAAAADAAASRGVDPRARWWGPSLRRLEPIS